MLDDPPYFSVKKTIFSSVSPFISFTKIIMSYHIYRQKAIHLLKDLREAIAGTDFDFTEGNLSRAVILLSVPMVLEMLMESVFAVVDIFFISKLGPDAVATVGITESLMTIVYAIGMGLAVGTTALISRRIGQKKYESASITAFQAIFSGLLVSILITVPGILSARLILGLMGANQEMISKGYTYTTIMLGGSGIVMLLFIINAIFRSSGDAAVSMRILLIANIINILLDPCLIFGLGPFPEMGVKGAAVATCIGRGIAIVYQFYLLFDGKSRIRLKTRNLILHYGTLLKLIRLSLGGIGQSLIATLSWIGVVRIVAQAGSEAMAGYTIAIRIIIFSLLPSVGLSNAASTLVGQNLGARKPDRAQRSVWYTGKVNMIFLGLTGLILVAVPGNFIRLFIEDPKVVESGISCLRIISYGFVMYALGMVMVQAFNGAGDTGTPTIINLFIKFIIKFIG